MTTADKLAEALRFIDMELSQHVEVTARNNPVAYSRNRARAALAEYEAARASPGPYSLDPGHGWAGIALLDAGGKEIARFRYRAPAGTAERNAERVRDLLNATEGDHHG